MTLARKVCAAALLLIASAALADEPRFEFPAGSRSSGTLGANDAHLYAVRLVEGTTFDAAVAGKKGFAPKLELLDASRTPVPTLGTLTNAGTKAALTRFVAPSTGTYVLRVSGFTPGSYKISSKAAPSKGGTRATTIGRPEATAQFLFQATAGGTAGILAKPAKGSIAEPSVVSVSDPAGAEVPLDARRTSAKADSCSVACATSGAYLVTVGTANGSTGALDVAIKIVAPKTAAASLKIDPSTRVADFAWFAAKIQPIFQNRGCNASQCHGAATGQGRMVLKGPTQGPFSMEDTYWNYFQLAQWVEVGNPESRALVKPLYIEDGGIYHGGGDIFRKADPEYQPFLDWCMGSSLASIPPVADAGADVHGYVGTQVMLDGKRSSDVERQSLFHRWTLVSKPGGSTAEIVDALSPTPKLTPDRSGVYLLQLVVTDTLGVASAPDQVAVAADANSQAGVITFEAEHGSISGGFYVEDDLTASNGKFVSRPSGAPQDGVASYLFSLDADGDYAVWGRVLAASSAHDSLRFRVDGGEIREWETPPLRAWVFDRGNDRMDRRAVVGGTSVLDVISGATWQSLRAETGDLRAVSLTGARMQFGTIESRMRFDTKLAGYLRNAVIVFDWLDDRNYLFAGMDDSANRVYIGSVADGLRTNNASVVFTVSSNQNYLFRVQIDADGTVHAFVDDVERATFRFLPDTRGIEGGLTGLLVERNAASKAAGWIDDLKFTDLAEGLVWADDFQTTPWTDPVVLALTSGPHQLDVLTGETGVKLDRIVVAPAALDPADAAGATRLVRRIYFDAANRSPTNDELILAPFLTTDGVAAELVNAYSYYLGWYEKNLVQFNLVGLNAPKTSDADYQALSSIPARLTNGEITEIQAYGEIAKSAAWARLNADSRDFVHSLFEEFLGRVPSSLVPPGGRSEQSAATNIYNATPSTLFGETGASATELVDIVLGLNGRKPDYNANAKGATTADTTQLHRAQVQLLWTRLVPATPIAAADLATWTAEYFGDATAVRKIVTRILQCDAYAADAATPRAKTSRQLIRGLYVDVLSRNPDLDTVASLEYAFVSSGDPVPLANELVQQMLRSADADPATPPNAGLDVDAWLTTTFVRTLGRLPTDAERTALEGFFASPAVTTDLMLEAILTSQEYLYY